MPKFLLKNQKGKLLDFQVNMPAVLEIKVPAPPTRCTDDGHACHPR